MMGKVQTKEMRRCWEISSPQWDSSLAVYGFRTGIEICELVLIESKVAYGNENGRRRTYHIRRIIGGILMTQRRGNKLE